MSFSVTAFAEDDEGEHFWSVNISNDKPKVKDTKILTSIKLMKRTTIFLPHSNFNHVKK